MKRTKQFVYFGENWNSCEFFQDHNNDVVLNIMISTRDSFRPQSLLHGFLLVKENQIHSLSQPPNRLDIEALIEMSDVGNRQHWEQLIDRFATNAWIARYVYQVRNPEMLESYLPIRGDHSFECVIKPDVPSIYLQESIPSIHIANWVVAGEKVFEVLSDLRIGSLEELQLKILKFTNAHSQFTELSKIMSNHCKTLKVAHPSLNYKQTIFLKETSPQDEKSLFLDYCKQVAEDGY